MEVRGSGRTVVVKAIGQLDACVPGEQGMMKQTKQSKNTVREITEMINGET